MKEYGLVRRTIYAARYLSDESYRRRISRQLNKGESLHALRRDLCYAHEGQIRHRHHEGQSEQALCLTVVTNAIVAWTTDYIGLAVDQLRAAGRTVENQVLAHISPAHNENIGFYGTFDLGRPGTRTARRRLPTPPATWDVTPAAVDWLIAQPRRRTVAASNPPPDERSAERCR